MKKILLIVIILIIIGFIGYLVYPSIINIFIKKYNSRIDYSCNIDTDCKTAIVGRGICSTPKSRCINENSDGGKLEYIRYPELCEAIEVLPDSCKCENSICQSYRNNKNLD